MFKGKRILLGITGGIAAYKSAWLVRELVKEGAEVQVVMTRSATQFITPLTLSTLSRREVLVDMFPPSTETGTSDATRHISLALWADAMVIAPATANTIAKIAHGLADDLLSTLVLALRCPLGLAPSMDADMYRNEVTQRNIDTVKELGCLVIDPGEGDLASGLSGPGRLPEVDRLLAFLDGILARAHHDLRGKKVLGTAGPTHEPVDPVRYIGNRSSGRMGFAIATAAAHRGGDVTLVSGPVHLRTPRNVRRIDVETAQQMQQAVEQEFQTADLIVMSAAVGDFAPSEPSATKIKREEVRQEPWSIALRRNPDILQSVGERKGRRVLVGFALETGDGVANARGKLAKKHLDMIVLNNPTVEGAGFGAETNVVAIIRPDGKTEQLPRMSKYDVAHEILNRAVPLLP